MNKEGEEQDEKVYDEIRKFVCNAGTCASIIECKLDLQHLYISGADT